MWIRAGQPLVLVGIMKSAEQIFNDIEQRLALVVGEHKYPRRYLVMRARQHLMRAMLYAFQYLIA